MLDGQRGFRGLKVWQDAMDLVADVLKIAEKLPKEELYGLGLQIRRSAVSIPSNIAEGWGRNGSKEFCHFLDIAFGSLCELETQLEIIKRCYTIEISDQTMKQCQSIHRQVIALKRTITNKAKS